MPSDLSPLPRDVRNAYAGKWIARYDNLLIVGPTSVSVYRHLRKHGVTGAVVEKVPGR